MLIDLLAKSTLSDFLINLLQKSSFSALKALKRLKIRVLHVKMALQIWEGFNRNDG